MQRNKLNMKQTSIQLQKPKQLMKKPSQKRYYHLPREILEEIFNRVSLPIKTIIGCRNLTNCNHLSCIFSDPNFAESQSKQYTRPCILAYHKTGIKTKIDPFFLIERTETKFLSTTFNLNFMGNYVPTEDLDVLDSCNGLLLLKDHDWLLFWVVNPLTKEYIELPKPNEGFINGSKTCYALGFSPKSENYKVLRLVGDLRPADGVHDSYYLEFCWHAEVLTLGTNTWRKINGCDLVFKNGCIDEGPVMINGALYWLCHVGQKHEIIRFENELEEFELMSSPLDVGGFGYSLSSLGVIDNLLCVGRYETRKYDDLSHGMEIWVLSNCGVWNIWKKISVVYDVDNMRCVRTFRLIKIDENEDLLLMMLSNPMKLVYYDIKKRTAREGQLHGVDKMVEGVLFSPNLRSIRTCIKDVKNYS